MARSLKAKRFPENLTISVRSVLFAHVTALLLLVFCYNSVRNARAQDQSGDEVIRISTDFVMVPTVVTDARGSRIPNLKQGDFKLRSDGGEVKIEYFAAGTERVALLFALDASGSTRDVLAQQRGAALSLFKHFSAGSRAAVLDFGESSTLVLPFTTEQTTVSSALNAPAASERRTAIFDAAAASLRAFDSQRGDPSERRIVVLLSDGLDNASATSARTVIKEARRSGVSFYVIHIPLYEPQEGRLRMRPPSKGFRELAEQTGGRYFVLGDARSSLDPRTGYDLAPVFRAIEEDLRGQYILGFHPAEAARDGRAHTVEVSLASPSNRKLRIQALRQEYILRP